MPRPEPGRTRRRAVLYARRALAAVPGRGLSRRCLFLHLPKCGGTSLAEGLYGTVPIQARVGVIDAPATRRAAALLAGLPPGAALHEETGGAAQVFALREALALTHLAWGTALIHGHLLLTDRLLAAARAEGVAIVTMMRAPEARALSNYRMAVRAGVLADDPDAWLDGPAGRRMALAATRYLAGLAEPPAPGAETDRALDVALARLPAFALIGVLERAAAFRDAFARGFGPRPALPRLNRAPQAAPALTDGQAARLAELCAPDRVLLRAAEARFGHAAHPDAARVAAARA